MGIIHCSLKFMERRFLADKEFVEMRLAEKEFMEIRFLAEKEFMEI